MNEIELVGAEDIASDNDFHIVSHQSDKKALISDGFKSHRDKVQIKPLLEKLNIK